MVTYHPQRQMAVARAAALSPELTARDILNVPGGLRWSKYLLWREFCQANLFEEIPAVAVPIYFVAGRYDRYTNPALEARYLERLQAPKKAYVLFERSGHAACYEEPERFQEVMLQVLRENRPPIDAPAPSDMVVASAP